MRASQIKRHIKAKYKFKPRNMRVYLGETEKNYCNSKIMSQMPWKLYRLIPKDNSSTCLLEL